MTLRLHKRAIALALSFTFGMTCLAQQTMTTEVGRPVRFEIESKVVNPHLKQCSIVVTQPSSSDEVVVLEAPNFRTALSYTPTIQGTSVVSWKGAVTLDGKVHNQVVGAVTQLFGNIGELLTMSKLSQLVSACPGNGTITIVATTSVRPATAPAASLVTPAPAQTPNRLRSTASIPTVMNPPIENSAFRAKYTNDPTYREMVDDFNVNRSKQSLTALRLYSQLGDANAQFLFGLAHLEDWTGLYDPKMACYWIRESAVQGLSQARLVLANKAVYNKDCFDVPPTLDEAKTWAQLAGMSSERAVKENAEKLLQDILRLQITNQR
jgi:hypothetical protein